MSRYKTAGAYRSALEAKLMTRHKEDSSPLARLRKSAAFDAFLARLARSNRGFVLKGGYALELRLKVSRSTKDLDLDLDFVTKMILRSSEENLEAQAEALWQILELSVRPGGGSDDHHFSFTIGLPMRELSGAGGGWRFPVRALLGGRKFEDFHVDVAAGDFVQEDNELINVQSRARPSGDEPLYQAELITVEQHFAEKLHAYTMPRDSVNSRVKDLVDMVLLIKAGLDERVVKSMLAAVFAHRKTHAVPVELDPPPTSWLGQYERLAKECVIELSIKEAFTCVSFYYAGL